MPLLLMTGCATEVLRMDDEDEGNNVKMLMAVLPPAADPPGGSDPGSDAECAYSKSALYIGSFDTDGTYKEYFLRAGVENPDQAMNAKFFDASWGPTMSVHLNTTKYPTAFIAAAFSVPTKCGSFSFASLSDTHASRTINWPGSGTNNVFTPADDEVNNIPMAGVITVTEGYIDEGYKRTPDIEMTRAMAKIVIEDPEQIIQSATLKTPDKGYLWPNTSDFLDGVGTDPTAPSNMTLLDQTLTEKVTVKDKNGDDVQAFVFYTYEQYFLNKAANDPARGVITLTANEASGLKDNDGNPRTTTIYVAPYSQGKPDTSKTASGLNTHENGVWKGIKRNHVYTFTVRPPQQMGLYITVHVKNWEYKKIPTEL